MTDIKPSDVVELILGGPEMTVDEVGENDQGVMTAWCYWFEDTKRMTGAFPVTNLKLSPVRSEPSRNPPPRDPNTAEPMYLSSYHPGPTELKTAEIAAICRCGPWLVGPCPRLATFKSPVGD